MITIKIVKDQNNLLNVVEFETFSNINSIYNVEIENWIHKKLIEYSIEYSILNFEETNYDFEFYYYLNNKLIAIESMVEAYYNL